MCKGKSHEVNTSFVQHAEKALSGKQGWDVRHVEQLVSLVTDIMSPNVMSGGVPTIKVVQPVYPSETI